MTFSEAIERYRGQLELLNYSPATIRAQSGYLRLFAEVMMETCKADARSGRDGSEPDALVVNATQFRTFQREIFYRPTVAGTARSVRSQNQILIAVKNLYRFLHEEGFISRDPAAELRYAREPQTLPRSILTTDEVRRILEAPDVHTPLGFRDRTILEVLYATGIRKAELLALAVGDVRLEEELLRINLGKGARDRVVPLSSIACRFLESYINAIRPQLLRVRRQPRGNISDRLFISLQARPLGRTTLDAIVSKYAIQAGIRKHVTCHVWRHTCATHLLQNRANLRHVQEILGHRSLVTTERYLRVPITELKEAHRRFHPREKAARQG